MVQVEEEFGPIATSNQVGPGRCFMVLLETHLVTPVWNERAARVTYRSPFGQSVGCV